MKAHKDNVLCENIVSRFYYGFILTVYCKKKVNLQIWPNFLKQSMYRTLYLQNII